MVEVSKQIFNYSSWSWVVSSLKRHLRISCCT